jgi:small subunit ribosomal protein S6
MNCYESIYILHPDLSDEAQDAARGRVTEVINKAGGRLYYREIWGKKRLAYNIAKQSRGIYQLIRFVAPGNTITELERLFRLEEDYLKHLCIRLDVDPDSVGELAEEPEEKREPSAAAETPAKDQEAETAAVGE